jgi:hypothetical protein
VSAEDAEEGEDARKMNENKRRSKDERKKNKEIEAQYITKDDK